ncbi:hypothetical protein Dda_7815 [Drechslerella dactyloides]|uniref:Uncharacterized protein n=1 Tax=Drechslerella dactyloides TaxID=74499 RepID=A0AAD6IV29_DREDA|nr:hypothetical protein Dda_7815 [Drechslerella dactyloides]
MSTQQYYSAPAQSTVDEDGVMTYTDRNGDIVQESSGAPIFRGLALAGGEAFAPSESEDESSDDEYTHHTHHHAAPYIPQQAPMYAHAHSTSPPQYAPHPAMMAQVQRSPSKKEKKEKKHKKSKKERSGSSSSVASEGAPQQHVCNCGHGRH